VTEEKQLTITAPVESTEQRLVDFLRLFIQSSDPTLMLTYRLLAKYCPTCIAHDVHATSSCELYAVSKVLVTHTHTHARTFYGPLDIVRDYPGEPVPELIWILLKLDSEWQWHQIGHMQICTSLQTDNYTSTPTTQFFTG